MHVIISSIQSMAGPGKPGNIANVTTRFYNMATGTEQKDIK
jgi:hypothetical protein